jgi:hypothetical protein
MIFGAIMNAWASDGIFVDEGITICTVTYVGPGVTLDTLPMRIPSILTWLPANSPGAVANLAEIVMVDTPPLVSEKAIPDTTKAAATPATTSRTRNEMRLMGGSPPGD